MNSKEGQTRSDKIGARRQLRRLANELQALPAAIALATNPIIPSEQVIKPNVQQAHHEQHKDPEERQIEQLKHELEKEYELNLNYEWSLQQLQQFKEVLQFLPKGFTRPQKGSRLNVEISNMELDNGCACWNYDFDQVRKTISYEEPHQLNLWEGYFRSSALFKIVTAHEITHFDTRLTVKNDPLTHKHVTVIPAQSELESVIGMPFKDFGALVHTRVNAKYPRLVQVARGLQVERVALPGKNKEQILFSEVLYLPKYKTLNKAYRWEYAVGYSYGQPAIDKQEPIEFLAVMAEWYVQGKDIFYDKMDGIVTRKTADGLYNLMKGRFFLGQEYKDLNHPIRPGKSSSKK